MSLPLKKTLGEMVQDLRDRLGHASQGAQGGPSTSVLKSLLRTSQYLLYWMISHKELIKIWEIGDGKATGLGVGLRFYEWDEDVHIDNILKIVIEDTTITQGNIFPLTEGIDWYDDAYASANQMPLKYDIRSQMELWPPPDRLTYIVRVEYIQRLGSFSVDNDRATIDDELVFIHALARAKAHYSKKDWQVAMQDAERLIRSRKAGSVDNQRFQRRLKTDQELRLIHKNTLDI